MLARPLREMTISSTSSLDGKSITQCPAINALLVKVNDLAVDPPTLSSALITRS